MIDARYQGKGYGKAALRLSIDHLRKEFGAKEIYLYYEPDNSVAERLYEKFGFKKTGVMEDGENQMRLDVENDYPY